MLLGAKYTQKNEYSFIFHRKNIFNLHIAGFKVVPSAIRSAISVMKPERQ